jgi:hypothetical protein
MARTPGVLLWVFTLSALDEAYREAAKALAETSYTNKMFRLRKNRTFRLKRCQFFRMENIVCPDTSTHANRITEQ